MGNTNKRFSLILVLILAASSLMVAGYVSAQSLKPAVTEFSLKLVDNSYDVPTSYEYTKDLYTGEVTTTTIPGYRVEDKSVVATIKNPPGVDAYNFRWKAHGESCWTYAPFDTETYQTSSLSALDAYGIRGYASDSEYTVFTLTFIPETVTCVDVQVQALYGDYRADPYTHSMLLPGGPTYDFHFDGQASHWSSTQTLAIDTGEVTTSEPTPSLPPTQTQNPSAPDIDNDSSLSVNFEQTVLFVLAVVIAALAVAVVALLRNGNPQNATRGLVTT